MYIARASRCVALHKRGPRFADLSARPFPALTPPPCRALEAGLGRCLCMHPPHGPHDPARPQEAPPGRLARCSRCSSSGHPPKPWLGPDFRACLDARNVTCLPHPQKAGSLRSAPPITHHNTTHASSARRRLAASHATIECACGCCGSGSGGLLLPTACATHPRFPPLCSSFFFLFRAFSLFAFCFVNPAPGPATATPHRPGK